MKSDLKKCLGHQPGREWSGSECLLTFRILCPLSPFPSLPSPSPENQESKPGCLSPAAGPREAADKRTESWCEGWALLYPLPPEAWRKGRGGKKRTERSGAEPLFPYNELWPMTSWPSPLLGARGISLPDIRLRSRERWAAGWVCSSGRIRRGGEACF